MDGYYAGTVGKYGNEDMIGKYVNGQGGNYKRFTRIDSVLKKGHTSRN